MDIIFEAMTQISFAIPLRLHLNFLSIAMNNNAQLNSAQTPKFIIQSLGCFFFFIYFLYFDKYLLMLAVYFAFVARLLLFLNTRCKPANLWTAKTGVQK